MPSQQATKNKRAKAYLARISERDRRRLLQQELKRIRRQMRETRAEFRVRKRKIREACKRSRVRVRARIRERRAEVLRALAAESAQLRAAAKDACARRLRQADAQKSKRLKDLETRKAKKARRLEEERIARDFKRGRVAARAPKKSARESDDEVRQNLDPDLVPIFELVRTQIKGSPRRTRTEEFLQWAEENPGEIEALRGEAAERDLQAELREHAKKERRIAKALSRKRVTPAALQQLGITAEEVNAVGLDPENREDVLAYLYPPEYASGGDIPF